MAYRLLLALAVALGQLALVAPGSAAAQAQRSAEGRRVRAAAELRLAVSPDRPRAGETVAVIVSAFDADGAPVDAKIELDCDSGELGPLARVVEGRYEARLALPTAIPHGRVILLAARAGEATAESLVQVGPARAASIAIVAPASVRADGSSSARIAVALADAFGNPADEVPRASAERGRVGASERMGPGRWAIDYVPGRRLDDGADVLVVDAGSIRREHAVLLTPRPAWLAVAPWMGVALGPGVEGLAFGVGLSAWRHVGGGAVGLALDAAFWRWGEPTDVAAPGGTLALDGERSYVPATVSLAYERRVGPRVSLAVHAGGGVSWVASTQQLAGQPEVSAVGVAPAAVAGVTVALRAWRGELAVEGRALWIGDPGLSTLSGSTWPFLVLLGYRLDGR